MQEMSQSDKDTSGTGAGNVNLFTLSFFSRLIQNVFMAPAAAGATTKEG